MTRGISNVCNLLTKHMEQVLTKSPPCDTKVQFLIGGKKFLKEWPFPSHQTNALQKDVNVIAKKTNTFITFLQEINKKP